MSKNEPDYNKRFWKALLGIIIVGFIGVGSLTFFAPKFGYLLGFLSRHRNDPGEVPFLKPNSPIFSGLPTATKDENIIIEGFAQKGMTVKLFVNGPERGKTTVDNEGVFTFLDIKLIPGRNTIFAKAIDSYNNESDKSQTHTVILDKDSPKIEISEPKNESTVRNLNSRIEITGEVNEKAQIYINGRMVIQKPDYTFSYLLGVDEGWTTVEVKAIDEAGNDSLEKIKVKYERKSS